MLGTNGWSQVPVALMTDRADQSPLSVRTSSRSSLSATERTMTGRWIGSA
jgi:hypothetical protein